MVSQTSVPQSGSFQASSMISAASWAVGGLGLGGWTAGGSASVIGFVATQFQRCARRNAPDRIQWIFRTVHSASGRQVCGVQ